MNMALQTYCRLLCRFHSLSRPNFWQKVTLRSTVTGCLPHSTGAAGGEDSTSLSQVDGSDVTAAMVKLKDTECRTPKEAKTNLLNFLTESDVQKIRNNVRIPYFTAGSYLAVTRADPLSPTGTTKFVGICIARRNKALGSTFILRNVINGIGVEVMFELYSPRIKEIQVLKLERRSRAKLYYLRDKPAKYSTVNEKMEPVKSKGVLKYRRRGAPA